MSNKIEILSFDEWINDNGFNFRPEQYDLYKFLYEAGQQSKQVEVDELKREMLNKTNEAYADGQKSMRKMIKNNDDELQKKIDIAIEKIESFDRYIDLKSVYEILKGEETK